MGKESYEIGREGEKIAESYLGQHGYQIIERNFRSQQGEVDIIAYDQEFLVFVEVKNYSYRSFGSPVGAISAGKKRSLIHAARTYIYKKKIKDIFCRFDVVAIFHRANGKREIELYKDAFHVN